MVNFPSGTGKTLTYLLPIMHHLKNDEELIEKETARVAKEREKLELQAKNSLEEQEKLQDKIAKLKQQENNLAARSEEIKEAKKEANSPDVNEPVDEENEDMDTNVEESNVASKREKELRREAFRPLVRRREGRPRALIVVPNRELAIQVMVSVFWRKLHN